jgi:hypothetical protein
MEPDSSRIYAFHSITRLSCSRLLPEQQLHTPYTWMLIGIAGTGIVFMENRQFSVSSDGALIGSPGSIVLQAEGRTVEWKLYFIELVPIIISHAHEISASKAEEAHEIEYNHMPHASELGTLAERLYSVIHMHPSSPQRSLTSH